MPNVASVLKEEIRRLSRKEAKALVAPLKKALAAERKALAALRKQVAANAKVAGKAARKASAAPATAPAAKARKGSGKGRTPALTDGWRKDTVRATRKSLGLTQGQFAELVGVSQITVSFWETGRSTPRVAQQESVLAARDLGRAKALAKLGLPPGYKARRGRPSKADLAARKAVKKKAGKRAAGKKRRKTTRGRKKK